MGLTVGAVLGVIDGERVGACVGEMLGFILGAIVGRAVGGSETVPLTNTLSKLGNVIDPNPVTGSHPCVAVKPLLQQVVPYTMHLL